MCTDMHQQLLVDAEAAMNVVRLTSAAGRTLELLTVIARNEIAGTPTVRHMANHLHCVIVTRRPT